MFQDTIIRDGHEHTIFLLRPPCRHLGERTSHRAKRRCENSTDYLPLYRCAKYRLCSPLGPTTDADLIHPCEACAFYRPRLAEIAQIINDTQ